MKNNRILYKVTTKDRKSCLDNFLGDEPLQEMSKFILTYNKDEIVEALDFTLGIACFTDFVSAKLFAEWNDLQDPLVLIVRPLAPLRQYVEIPPVISAYILEFYRHKEGYYSSHSGLDIKPPNNTVFCQKVKVLT